MFTPSKEILDKYAKVLIDFALNDCKGIKKGHVVLLQVHEIAKPMLLALRRAVLKSGGHPIIQFIPDNTSREFFELASDDQLTFFADKYYKGLVDQVDHRVYIHSETDMQELKGIDPKKLMSVSKSRKPYKEWLDEKENKGKLTWTLALYPTEQMAAEAGLSLEQYWAEVIKACYLDEEDPISKWKDITNEIERVKTELNKLEIDKVHVKGEDVDLEIGIGPKRKWLGASGRNIPSFELFISPDYRKTNGKIKFNQPLYRYGNIIKDVELEFKDGVVVKSFASQGEDVLKEMIATDEGSQRVGEFSLTDSRVSRITKFMANTLFDENVGGSQGNTHIALGNAYQDSYTGDPSTVSKKEWQEMGYNESVVHTDIVSTSKRTVTARLKDGSEKVIYDDGKFLV
ncbi:MAG: aminopeptidase [Candidatus Woesearchaeota archaeon]